MALVTNRWNEIEELWALEHFDRWGITSHFDGDEGWNIEL